jgi:hypothetical protein
VASSRTSRRKTLNNKLLRLTDSERRMKNRFRNQMKSWTVIATRPRTVEAAQVLTWRPADGAPITIDQAHQYTHQGLLVAATRNFENRVEYVAKASALALQPD